MGGLCQRHDVYFPLGQLDMTVKLRVVTSRALLIPLRRESGNRIWCGLILQLKLLQVAGSKVSQGTATADAVVRDYRTAILITWGNLKNGDNLRSTYFAYTVFSPSCIEVRVLSGHTSA